MTTSGYVLRPREPSAPPNRSGPHQAVGGQPSVAPSRRAAACAAPIASACQSPMRRGDPGTMDCPHLLARSSPHDRAACPARRVVPVMSRHRAAWDRRRRSVVGIVVASALVLLVALPAAAGDTQKLSNPEIAPRSGTTATI